MTRGLLLAFPLLCGCVTARLERERHHDALPPEAVALLAPGRDDLQRCLALLGAPLWVREHEVHGLAMGYGSVDALGWRLGVAAPVTQDVNASFRYESERTGLYGHVLYFDDELRLQRVVEGWLDVIAAAPPPATVEELEEDRP